MALDEGIPNTLVGSSTTKQSLDFGTLRVPLDCGSKDEENDEEPFMLPELPTIHKGRIFLISSTSKVVERSIVLQGSDLYAYSANSSQKAM
jgi:hypothetical protein